MTRSPCPSSGKRLRFSVKGRAPASFTTLLKADASSYGDVQQLPRLFQMVIQLSPAAVYCLLFADIRPSAQIARQLHAMRKSCLHYGAHRPIAKGNTQLVERTVFPLSK